MKKRKCVLCLGMVITLGAITLGSCGKEDNNILPQIEGGSVEILSHESEATPQTSSEEQQNGESVDVEQNIDTIASESGAEELDEPNTEKTIQVVHPTMISYTDSDGGFRYYNYDADGNLVKYSNSYSDEVYEYLTDEQGNKVYGYDSDELLNQYIDPAWDVHLFEYGMPNLNLSAHEEALIVRYSSGSRERQYVYDQENRMTEVYYLDSWGTSHRAYNYSIENGGMVINLTGRYGESNSESGEMKFDSEGYIISASYQKSSDECQIEYIYDSNHNLIACTAFLDSYDNDLYADHNVICAFTYDEDGNIMTANVHVTEEYYKDGVPVEETGHLRIEYSEYDENGNYSVRKHYSDDQLAEAYFFEYNEGGRLIKESAVVGGNQKAIEYHYDEQGRLSDISGGDVILYHIVYDSNDTIKKVEVANDYIYEKWIGDWRDDNYSSWCGNDLQEMLGKTVIEYTGIKYSSIYYTTDFTY